MPRLPQLYEKARGRGGFLYRSAAKGILKTGVLWYNNRIDIMIINYSMRMLCDAQLYQNCVAIYGIITAALRLLYIIPCARYAMHNYTKIALQFMV